MALRVIDRGIDGRGPAQAFSKIPFETVCGHNTESKATSASPKPSCEMPDMMVGVYRYSRTGHSNRLGEASAKLAQSRPKRGGPGNMFGNLGAGFHDQFKFLQSRATDARVEV